MVTVSRAVPIRFARSSWVSFSAIRVPDPYPLPGGGDDLGSGDRPLGPQQSDTRPLRLRHAGKEKARRDGDQGQDAGESHAEFDGQSLEVDAFHGTHLPSVTNLLRFAAGFREEIHKSDRRRGYFSTIRARYCT
jgi:hypothetical protein